MFVWRSRFLDCQQVWLSLGEGSRICIFKQTPGEFLSPLYFYKNCLTDMPGISLRKCSSYSLCPLWKTETRWRHFHQWALFPEGWNHDCKLLWAGNRTVLQTEEGESIFSLSRVVPPWPSPDWPCLSGMTTACFPAKGWRLRTEEALWLVYPVLNPPWCDGQGPCGRKRGFHSDVAPGESFLIGKISYFVSITNNFTQKYKVVILYLGVHFKILI